MFVLGMAALIRSLGWEVDVHSSPPASAGFLPRLEDDASARWLAIVGDQIDVFRASEALAMGASGVVLPDMAPDEFERALAALFHGDTYVSSGLVRAMSRVIAQVASPWDAARETLTHRELEVLVLVAQGDSNGQIAGKLNLSVNTVRAHLRSLFAKLEAHERTALVRVAWEMGLLTGE
ncbi:MAG TPA: response regulator transcription factor [Gemmatimonadales bacterium]|nr:response regulator transcription factor [Gemmatimonadales bacterium]